MRLDLPMAQASRARERLAIQPTLAPLLATHGLERAGDFFDLDGPIISGHPDRHVRRVTIGGESYYLKREHRVPLRERLASWLAGFGFVSISLREARVLDELEKVRIAAPPWVAAGETADGGAFLLLKDVGEFYDLRDHLRDMPRDRCTRRRLARRLAAHVARIHNEGFTYPDLYAKHILVDAAAEHFTFLDWQRSRRRRHLTWAERCRDLAALNASFADELADVDDRLTFLLAYWKAARDATIPFRSVCARIRRRTQKLLRRSSIREQRLPALADSQPLHWLDGERLCVSERGRELLDAREVERLAYSAEVASERRFNVAGIPVLLSIRRTRRRLGRIRDAVHGKHWQAPECRRAAQLLREERLGAPRRLLAFGQWERSWGCVDSFLLQTAEPADAEAATC